MADNAVRELITKIKFLCDGAGIEAAKRKVADLKTRMSKMAQEKIKIDVDTSKIEAAKKKLENIGGKLTSGGMALTAAGAGVLGAIGLPVKTAADFEATMSKVAAITGASASEMKELTDLARQLGRDTIFSASESGEAMTYLGMAGWKNEDIKAAMPALLDLATATGDLATTADIISDDLTAFGMKASEAGKMADVFAAASMNANTNVSMMGHTFSYFGPVAGALGYSIQDAALATGILANASIKGERAGTQLRAIVSNLISPTNDAAKVMAEMGLEMTNADGTVKPFRQTLMELREKMGGLTKAQQSQYAESIAGKEAMAGLLTLVNASQEDWDKLTKAIDNSDGAAHRFSETSKNNLRGSLKELQSAAEELAIELGNALLPDFTVLSKKVREATNWLSKFAKEHPRVVAGIMGMAAAFGALLVGLGGIGMFAGGIMQLGAILMPVFGWIGGALSGIGAIASGPVLLAFAAVAGMIGFIAENWELFYSWIEPGLGMISEGVGLLAEAFGEVFAAVSPLLPPLWEIVKIIGGILVAVLAVLFDVVAWVFNAWAKNIKTLADLLNNLKEPIAAVADMLSGAIGKAKELLGFQGDLGGIEVSARDAEYGGGGRSYSSNQEFTVNVNSVQEASEYTKEVSESGLPADVGQ